MSPQIYVRPEGLLPPDHAPGTGQNGHSLVVAGLSFAAGELIERDGGTIRRSLNNAAELHATAGNEALSDLLQRLCGKRAPVADLRMDEPHIMGIVNVTPDSFSDGGRFLSPDAAIEHALRLEAEGASILDIGGESTRPGSHGVNLDEECGRVLPVIKALVKKARARLSIDTRKAEVMRRAALEGVHIINDVSALTHDAKALETAAATGLPIVLMHSYGEPQTMQDGPTYQDVALDVYDWLEARVQACELAGIARDRLVVDPGIGFGKTLDHNLALLRSLSIFHGIGCPLLLGASRKSFIGRFVASAPDDRLPGSLAAALIGVAQAAQILRVHDVAATRQAVALWRAVSVVA